MKSVPKRRFAVSTLLALATVLATAVSPAAAKQGPWILPAKTIAETRQVDSNGSPEVAVGPGSTATAVWLAFDRRDKSDETDDLQLVRATTRAPGAKFGKPFTLASAPVSMETGDRFSQVHVVAGNRGTLVSWVKGTESRAVVQARFRPKGKRFGAVVNLSNGSVFSPVSVADGSDGTFAVAWKSEDGIIQTTVRTPHHGFSQPKDITTPDTSSLTSDLADLTVDRKGTVVLTWEAFDFASLTETLRVATLPEGKWNGNRMTVATGTFGSESGSKPILDPRIATTPSREVVVAWAQGDPESSRIYFSTRKPGTTFSDPRVISGAESLGLSNDSPQIAAGGDGVVSIAFRKEFEYHGEDGGGNPAVFSYRTLYVATGKPGGKFLIRGLGGGLEHSAANPRIVASANGITTVLWSEGRSGSGQSTMHTTTRRPGGTYPNTRSWTQLSDGYLSRGSLATGPDGSAVAVWLKSAGDSRNVKTASTKPAKRKKTR